MTASVVGSLPLSLEAEVSDLLPQAGGFEGLLTVGVGGDAGDLAVADFERGKDALVDGDPAAPPSNGDDTAALGQAMPTLRQGLEAPGPRQQAATG
jgi:hypothetical protein